MTKEMYSVLDPTAVFSPNNIGKPPKPKQPPQYQAECKICGKRFKSFVNAYHLKTVHGITGEEYKQQYDPDAITSPTVAKYGAKTKKEIPADAVFVECKICGKNMRSFINPAHLRLHHISPEQYREQYDPDAIFTLVTAWNKGLTKETNESMAKASRSHMTPEYRERFENSMLEAHGVKYMAQDPEAKVRIIEGMKQTNLDKYGVENWGQTEEGRKITSQTGKDAVAKIRERFFATGYRTLQEQRFHEMFPHFACNTHIGTGKGGCYKYGCTKLSPDFLDGKIVVEIDGDFHKLDDIKKKDERKEQFYHDNGYILYRFSNAEVDKVYEKWVVDGLPTMPALEELKQPTRPPRERAEMMPTILREIHEVPRYVPKRKRKSKKGQQLTLF